MRCRFCGKHIGGQLVRCGTAGGANYEEARGAESRADFAHKAGVAQKETRESVYWLRLTERSVLAPELLVKELIQEGQGLVAILKKSVITAKSNMK